MAYPGIDYSLGTANIDPSNGIHYGVIPVNAVAEFWSDNSTPDYGDPTCECGSELIDYDPDAHDSYRRHSWRACDDLVCVNCQIVYSSDAAYGDEPSSWDLDDGEYVASQSGDDRDIFITSSPFYTRSQFCSPCAPGAGYLLNPVDSGPKTYCFGPEVFDDGDPCPYPVWRVSDNKRVYSPFYPVRSR